MSERLRVYGFCTQNNGCAKYRIWQPLKSLARTGLATIRREPDNPGMMSVNKASRIFRWADVVYAQPSSDLLCTSILLAARDYHKKKLIMDLDDNIWAVHPLNIGPVAGKLRYLESIFGGEWEDFWELVPYEGKELNLHETVITLRGKEMILRQKSPDAKVSVDLLMKECDGVTTTNPYLADVFRKHTDKPVYVVPNRIDCSEWRKTVEQDTDKVTIGWCGSVSHYPDLEPLMGTMDKIMDKYPNVHVQIMGSAFAYLFPIQKNQDYLPVPGYDGGDKSLVYADVNEAGQRWPGRMTFNKPVDVQKYVPWMNENWKGQIGIAPLLESEFNDSKSELKWLEYSALGAVTVASKVGPYKRAIRHDKDGKLCSSNGAWLAALEELIESPGLRKGLVRNARRRLLNEYNSDKQAHKLMEILAR